MSKYKPYPQYKDSGVEWLGEVPVNWAIERAKWLFIEQKRAVKADDEIITCFRDGEVTLRKNRKIDGFTNALKEHGYQGVRKGDLVIHNMDAFAGAIGISDSDGKSTPVYSVCTQRKDNTLNSSFYAYFLRNLAKTGFIESLAKGIRERSTDFRFSDFGILLLSLPPLKEQNKIVNFIDNATCKIDTLIQKQQNLIELLKEKRQAAVENIIMQDHIISMRLGMVVDQIFRPVDRKIDEFYVALGLYNRGRGLFHKEPKEGSELGDSDFFWIQNGDLILSGQFAWEGAVALAGESENNCIVSHRYPVLRGKENIINTEYLWAFLTTKIGDFILNENSVGSAGRNRPLNINTLMKEKIPIPNFEAQLKISRIVQIEKKISESIAKTIELLKERRTALISAAVTGKIDVREITK